MSVYVNMPTAKRLTSLLKIGALGVLLLLVFAPVLATIPNPYNKTWRCVAQKHKWGCAEVMPTVTVLPKGTLERRRQHKKAIADQLGWIQDSSDSNVSCSVCQGHYYVEPLPANKTGQTLSTSKTIIDHIQTAKGNLSGYVSLTGPVKITQPSRILYADYVTLKQDKTTKKIRFIRASGHLRLHQPDSLLLGQKGKADLANYHANVDNAHYLYKVPSRFGASVVDPNFLGYAHGNATSIKRLNQNELTFDNATYSTCPPIEDTWQLKAHHLNLNKVTGRGHAYNMWLKVQRIPIFYTPYFSFPLNNKRYSGFLYPLIGLNSKYQTWLAFPYYFNLAPNMDDTLYPITYTTPGAPLQAEVLHNKFRYLFGFGSSVPVRTSGKLNFDALVYQKTVKNFLALTQNIPVKRGIPTISVTNATTIGSHINTSLTYQYIRDQAFLNVYPNLFNGFSKDQTSATRSFSADYADLYWNITLLVQKDSYLSKTVGHLIPLSIPNQAPATLPQIDFTFTPPSPSWVNASVSGQFINTVKSGYTPLGTTTPVSFNQGIRYHLDPDLSFPITPSYGFFNPEVSVFLSRYDFRSVDSHQPQTNPHASLSVPIFDIHAGLYFDRDFSLGDTHYQQTVEPELFYLYVPYHNQYTVPILGDTSYTDFSYASLFSTNRFVGYDRIGDANQLSASLSTTINNAKGNSLHVGVGEIFYFRDRLVSMNCNPNNTDPNSSSNYASCMLKATPYYRQKYSPVATTLDYILSPHFTFHTDLTYNQQSNAVDHQNYTLQYLEDTHHVFNIAYTSGINYDLLTQEQRLQGQAGKSQSLLSMSSIWKVSAGWSLIGSVSYSANDQRVVDAFGGFKYDSCCWSMQLLAEGIVDGINPNNPGNYSSGAWDRRYVLSFNLKGLGGVDQSGVNALLSRIPGSGVTSPVVQ